MCRCLSTQNSQRAVGGTAHASDHTSHRVRPWMLTLSNCVKPYLTSYRVVSHASPTSLPRLLLPGTSTAGPNPGYVAKVGEDRSPRPPAHLPGGSRGMRRFGGRSLGAEPPIRPRAGLPRPPSSQTPSDTALNMYNATDGPGIHIMASITKMNKYNTIPNKSLGGQHSRDGCQSLSRNTDILQVRHTLPAAQCFYNAVLHSLGGRRSSRPNAEAVAAVLPLIEAGFPQCLSNHATKRGLVKGFQL